MLRRVGGRNELNVPAVVTSWRVDAARAAVCGQCVALCTVHVDRSAYTLSDAVGRCGDSSCWRQRRTNQPRCCLTLLASWK